MVLVDEGCEESKYIYYNAPINVMPDPREGGDTRGIDLTSLLLGRGFEFI